MTSRVEDYFGLRKGRAHIPYVVAESFPQLGMITALRFLEWVNENPQGVISLPTGKTPEFFIRWTQYLLTNWDSPAVSEIRSKVALNQKPDLSGLHFVQIDEFYPVSSRQKNSFFSYVMEFYIHGFGLNPDNALLINSDEIPLADGKHFSEVFPDLKVDLSLRYRTAETAAEIMQQKSIFLIDEWCWKYEQRIRVMGGIGFFLGGIGPDGHIAFNTRGSDHFSTTRLTPTNFETQAVSAGDLGGMAVSGNKLVITIGLGTICYNKDAVAIIFAASESKAKVIRQAVESEPSVLYPASALQQLSNSRFYLTEGATLLLKNSIHDYYQTFTPQKTEKAIIDLCSSIERYGDKITLDELQSDAICRNIPNLSLNTVQQVITSVKNKLKKGAEREEHQVFLHTGPHHDDIMLGIMPHVNRQLRSATNVSHFAVLTSGFTAVTNAYFKDLLLNTKHLLDHGQIQMVHYPDFFSTGYKYKWFKDVHHYLDKVAARDKVQMRRGISHRIVRILVQLYGINSIANLKAKIDELIEGLKTSYDGEKNSPDVQQLKGMIREFEEELVWAHFGVKLDHIHHLRLGFYTGDIFTEQPEIQRDVEPVIELIKKVNPTVISLAMDPEGSGPDTHYKVLQAIAESLRILGESRDLTGLKIWGYRNVWYRFHPADVNMIVPVSMNALAVLRQSFQDCYLSQVEAPFPSYELNGMFCDLTQKIWVEQMRQIQLLLGKDFFYNHASPLIRATHGLIYLKEMTVPEFLVHARELQQKAGS